MEKESAHDFAKKRYFKEPTSYGNQTQYDLGRIIIRASKGDYSEGAVLHMLELMSVNNKVANLTIKLLTKVISATVKTRLEKQLNESNRPKY